MIPFRNLFQLFAGDVVAKALYFLAFVYLARTLGVESYGVLEFSLSVLTYFLILGDGGLDYWATREVARGRGARELVGIVVPLRLVLALIAFIILLGLLPLFPAYPGLKTILTFYGLTLFAQALSLKWVFMGREKMSRVALGLALAQIIFVLVVFGTVKNPEDVVWVPILKLISDLGMAVYFAYLFFAVYGKGWPRFYLTGSARVLRAAMTIGVAQGLALMSYNFDSIILGFLIGSAAVGWYGAAYKPITAVLAIPLTYYIGLFPTLSRTFQQDRAQFEGIIIRSLRLASVVALPIGVGGTFLAGPIVQVLFGDSYANSIGPVQILSWSAVIVILRGTLRQSLNAAGRQDLDLRCAGASIILNVSMNMLLIPQYGILGAAVATVVAETLWLLSASYYLHRSVVAVTLLPSLWRPLLAASLMATYLFATRPLPWLIQSMTSVVVYFVVLWLLGEPEVKSLLLRTRQVHVPWTG